MSFLKIADAKAANKGSFIGTVIKQGDLKSGTTKDGKDWTKKVFTIEDDSDTIEITAWDEEIKLFKVGNKYEIVNPWWKIHDGKLNLNVGQYCQVKLIGTSVTQSTMEQSSSTTGTQSINSTETAGTAPTSDEFLKARQKEIREKEIAIAEAIEEKTKSIFSDEELGKIDQELDRLIVLEDLVTKKLTTETVPNPAKVGMYMKFIDDKFGVKK